MALLAQHIMATVVVVEPADVAEPSAPGRHFVPRLPAFEYISQFGPERVVLEKLRNSVVDLVLLGRLMLTSLQQLLGKPASSLLAELVHVEAIAVCFLKPTHLRILQGAARFVVVV